MIGDLPHERYSLSYRSGQELPPHKSERCTILNDCMLTGSALRPQVPSPLPGRFDFQSPAVAEKIPSPALFAPSDAAHLCASRDRFMCGEYSRR